MNSNKRLKILFLPAWYPSEQNPVNGIFIKEHAKAVSLFNDIIVIYSEGWDKNLDKAWNIVSDRKEDGIRTIRIRYKKSPIPKTTYFFYLRSIKLAFKKLLEEGWKPDVIHAHVFSAGVPAIVLGEKYKIPVAITEHYTNFATHSLRFIERIKAKFAMKRANVILPVSNDLKNSILDYYGIKNKVIVVPNTIDFEKFNYVRDTNNKNSDKELKRLLTVCVLNKRKGIEYLLKALHGLRKKRKDFLLDIVGDGPKRKEFEELSERLDLREFVKFHGRQPEIVSFMKRCDFFILPSFYENFGVVYIEAMACGKPVIGTNAGGPKEIINADTGILVPPKNVDALVEAIDFMLDNYEKYSTDKIKNYVKANFSYRVVGQKLDKIYRSIVPQNSIY